MRTRIRFYATLTAIAALGVLVLSPASASADGKGKKLRIVATESQSDFIDEGTAGPSLGDELVFSETLSRNGREVGDAGVVCTVTHVEAPYDVVTFHCVATLRLQRGQITLQGLIDVQGQDDPGPFTVAITGGTGAFRGAGGQARIRDRPDMTTVYKLSFDKKKKDHR